jgi:hypothetical protein
VLRRPDWSAQRASIDRDMLGTATRERRRGAVAEPPSAVNARPGERLTRQARAPGLSGGARRLVRLAVEKQFSPDLCPGDEDSARSGYNRPSAALERHRKPNSGSPREGRCLESASAARQSHREGGEPSVTPLEESLHEGPIIAPV